MFRFARASAADVWRVTEGKPIERDRQMGSDRICGAKRLGYCRGRKRTGPGKLYSWLYLQRVLAKHLYKRPWIVSVYK